MGRSKGMRRHASGEDLIAPYGDEELCAVTLVGDVENDFRVARHLSLIDDIDERPPAGEVKQTKAEAGRPGGPGGPSPLQVNNPQGARWLLRCGRTR